MKLFIKSPNGRMIKVGETAEKAKFYFLTDAVKPKMGQFNIGDEVTISTMSENGADFCTDIVKGSAGITAPTPTPVVSKPASTPAVVAPVAPVKQVSTGSTASNGNNFTPVAKKPFLPKEEWIAQQKAEGKWNADAPKTSYSKSPEEQNTIKRQAIAHATSRAMIGMQHLIDGNNIEEVMERVYKKFQELVG